MLLPILITVRTVFKLLFERSGWNDTEEERKNNKIGTFATTHFCIYLSAFGQLYMSLADHKSTQRGRLDAYISF